MADKKMLILRGNPTDDPDTYPDEQGKTRAWPDGALHEKAARAFARKLGYADVVIEAPGLPQGPDSKQATKATHLVNFRLLRGVLCVGRDV